MGGRKGWGMEWGAVGDFEFDQMCCLYTNLGIHVCSTAVRRLFPLQMWHLRASTSPLGREREL